MALLTNFWGLDGMIFLTALVTAAYFYTSRKFQYWKKRGVWQVPPIPFLGNFKECTLQQKSAGNFMKELHEQAKGLPYIGFYICYTPSLLIRDLELIKRVLVKDFNHFADRYASADVRDRLGYANLFILKNPAWKIVRAKLTPIFTSNKLKKMFKLILVCADNLDMYLDSLRLEDKEKTLGVREIASKYTTDVIASTAYGLEVNSLKNPDAEFRKYGRMIFDCSTYIRSFEMLAMFFFPNIVHLARIKMIGKEANTFLRKVFWEIIKAREQSGQKRHDLIDILLELKKNHSDKDIDGFKFDGDDLVAQAVIFFTAGFEASSLTISFTLYELARQPEIQDRLRKEILDALNETHGEITYDLVTSLPYLDMVISETLRMYPTLPFLDRVTTETYKVPNSNLVLEKGTPVYISISAIHMDPDHFPDPEKYDPERFNKENRFNRPPGIYFPFGEGPRACNGFLLGLLQTKLALIKFISKYRLTTCEETLVPMVLDPKASFAAPLGGEIYLNVQKINV